MIKRLFVWITILAIHSLIPIYASAAAAKPTVKFTGSDYSGVYACKGSNAKIGNYELVVTFVMNKASSRGKIGSYDLTIVTENSTSYSGQAIANGNVMAITIEIVDDASLAYSTGVALAKPIKPNRFSYVNQYYESKQTNSNSEVKDIGNYGTERCIMYEPKN